MAGVKGMGAPEDINQNPQASMNVPEIDYDALVSQAMQQQTQQPQQSAQMTQSVQTQPVDEIDYSALVDQAMGAPAEDPERSLMDQIQQFPARFEASFANTPERKQFVLERRYGKENVRKNKSDSFDIKKDNKWIKFDSDQFEVLNDIVADWGRDAIGQGATELATVGGLAAAGVSTVGTGGAGIATAAPIVAASRVAGGAAGNALAQVIANDIYGIPKGSVAEQASEIAISGALNAVFGRVGDRIGSYFAKKGAEKATRIANQTVNESLATDIKVLKEASDELEQAGIIEPVKNQFGGKTTFLPEQATMGNEKDIALRAKVYSENPEVQNVKGKLMDGLNQVIEKINNKIAAVSPIKGSKILEYANDIEIAEGSIIGKYKNMALEQGAKTRVNADIAREKIKSSMENLGYSFFDTVKTKPSNYVAATPKSSQTVKEFSRPTMESLEARGFSPEAAKKLMDRLESTYKEILGNTVDGRTKITFEKLSGINNNYKELVNELYNKSDVNVKSRKILTEIKDSLGDDYEKAIGAILGDTPAGKEFSDAMSKFSNIKNAKKDLGRILIDSQSGEPTIAAEALAKNLFGSGKSNLKEITAMKKLLKDDPDIWDQIKRVHLDELMRKNWDSKIEKYDVLGYADDILKLPKDVALELVGSAKNLNLIKSARVYANRLQNYTVEDYAKSEDARKAIQKALVFLTNYAQTKGLAVFDMFSSVGRNRSLSKYLSDEGRDQMLKLTPVDGRPALNRVIDNIIETGAFSENRAIKAARIVTNGAVTPAAKAGTRKVVTDAVYGRDNKK